MKKFVNHVDHVQWICRLENAERHIADLEAITDAKLMCIDRSDVGCLIYIDWSAGLEVVVPLAERTASNQFLHDWLETRGEGLFGIAFGVADLEKHGEKLEAKGFKVGPMFKNLPVAPWPENIVLRERPAPSVINSNIVISQIDYDDEIISFEEAK
jgi:hypothetical protein